MCDCDNCSGCCCRCECRYCRNPVSAGSKLLESVYRRKYVCFDCKIGWKNQQIQVTRGSNEYIVETNPTIKKRIVIKRDVPRCRGCSKDGISVGRDAHIPKPKDTKGWIKFKEYFDKHGLIENCLKCSKYIR